ncbi:36158_t:CDS:2, partial [Racocetra persica]
ASRVRTPPCSISLQTLPVSPSSLTFLDDLEDYIRLKKNELKIHGLTWNEATSEYMMVVENFDSKREYFKQTVYQSRRRVKANEEHEEYNEFYVGHRQVNICKERSKFSVELKTFPGSKNSLNFLRE